MTIHHHTREIVAGDRSTDDVAALLADYARLVSPTTLAILRKLGAAATRGNAAEVELWRRRQLDWTRAVARVRSITGGGLAASQVSELRAALEDAIGMWRRWQ